MKRYEKAGLISLCLILIFLYLWKTDRADLCDGRMKEDAFLSFADAAAREAEEAEWKAKMEKISRRGRKKSGGRGGAGKETKGTIICGL